MQDLVKRYFWVIGAVTVMVCAYFAASTANAIVEAKFLGASPTAPVIPFVMQDIKPVAQARSKVGQPVADRNMFCSDCKPPVVASAVPDNAPPGSVAMTSLHLVLIATSISSRSSESFASILNTDTSAQGG